MPAYVARKRLKHNGEWIEPGEPVPDVESWPSFRALLNGEYIGYADGPPAGWQNSPHRPGLGNPPHASSAVDGAPSVAVPAEPAPGPENVVEDPVTEEAPKVPPAESSEASDESLDLGSLTVAVLKTMCTEAGLSTSGSKADLVARLGAAREA